MTQVQQTQTAPQRRIRVKKDTKVVTTQDKTLMTKNVNRYAELQITIEEAQREQAKILLEQHGLMKGCGVKEWETKNGKAERYTPASRNSTNIDKDAFRERVSDEDFMDCVKVSVTEAKKVLSGKELELISEIVPGAKKAETCRVKVFKPES